MENEININGTTYINKDILAKKYVKVDIVEKDYIKKDLYNNTIKDIEQGIAKLTDLKIGVKKVNTADVNLNRSKVQQATLPQVTKVNVEDWINNLLASSKMIYNKFYVQDGCIKDEEFNELISVKDIIDMKKEMDKKHIDVDKWANKINKSVPTVKRIFFNIHIGTFDEYTKTEEIDSRRSNDVFDINKIPEAHKFIYTINVNREGKIGLKNGHSHFNMDQVQMVKERVNDQIITVSESKEIAKDIGINPPILEKISYSIEKGVFDPWLPWTKGE